MKTNPIVRACWVVFGFWWCGLTGLAIVPNLGSFGDILNQTVDMVDFWFVGCLCGGLCGVWWVWFYRVRAENRLFTGSGQETLGMMTTLGRVPMICPLPDRVSSNKKRLPIPVGHVSRWLSENETTNPAYVALFFAVWDVYSRYHYYPATHRKGGHGNRKLWQHSLAVAEKSLERAPNWSYAGLFTKKRGRARMQILQLRNPSYVFDPEDPLIPIVAIAHDIGKLEAFKVFPDGRVESKEEGASYDHDDVRIIHDTVGARILARFPEYWALPFRERRTLNMVVGHYHHPSGMPVDVSGQAIEDRIAALTAFLIDVDKETGKEESGRDMTEDTEITEDQSREIFGHFVDLMSTYGRINGTGNRSDDAQLKIGQKHDGLIIVKEPELRKLLLSRMGWSLTEGEHRNRVTVNLMLSLEERGVLYTEHKGVDFSRFIPMFAVSFREPNTGKHLAKWDPVLIFRPLTSTPEFSNLCGLPDCDAKLEISRPVFTHQSAIQDAVALRELISSAFGEEVARAATIGGRIETKSGTAARLAGQTEEEEQEDTSDERGSPAGDDVIQEEADPVAVLTMENASTAEMNVDTPLIDASDLPAITVPPDADEHLYSATNTNEIPDIPDVPGIGLDEVDPFHDLMLEPEPPSDGVEADAFADFESTPNAEDHDPAPVVIAEPQPVLKAATGTCTELYDSEGPLIVDIPGKTIVDTMNKARMVRRTEREEQAILDALDDNPLMSALSQAQIFGSKPIRIDRKLSGGKATRAIQKAIREGTIPVCGKNEGRCYVLDTDLASCLPQVDLAAIDKNTAVHIIAVGDKGRMIGVPEHD